MALVQRIKDILLKPREAWPVINAEPAETVGLYSNYIALIAVVPAVATFIGLSLVGVAGFRLPLGAGLVNMLMGYVLSLVMVFVLALLVDALAPTFGGTKSPISALKLVGYGATAGFLGGIFNLVPALSILGLLAALYSIYLIYTGLPVLMQCPADKAVPYTAVVIVCGIVAGVLVGAVTSALSPRGGLGMGSAGRSSEVAIKTPQGEVNINTAKMEEMAKQMEAAGKQMEKAQVSGDAAAAGQAAAAMMGALAGGGKPMPPQDLKALLPESLGSLKRESFEASGGGAMGMAGSTAKGVFSDGDKRVQLSISDLGGMGGLMAVATWAGGTVDREDNNGSEKVYKEGKRTVREQFRKDGSRGEYTVILENGLVVEAKGNQTNIGTLKGVVAGLNLDKIGALKRPAQ